MNIQTLQTIIVDALEDVKAQDIVVFDTTGMTSLFDRVVIASGTSNRQTRSLANNVREKIKEAGGVVGNIEGEETGEWVLLDCIDAVVHVMQPAIRQYYRLEEIWGGKPVNVKRATPSTKTAAKTAAKPAAKKAASKTAAPAETSKTAAKTPAKKAPVRSVTKASSTERPAPKKTAAKKAPVSAARKTVAAKLPSKLPSKTATKTLARPAAKAPAKKAAPAKVLARKPAVKTKAAPAKKVAAKKTSRA
jgi:ribosome-associated protein